MSSLTAALAPRRPASRTFLSVWDIHTSPSTRAGCSSGAPIGACHSKPVPSKVLAQPDDGRVRHICGHDGASFRRLSAEQNGHASADAGEDEGRDEDHGDGLGVHGYGFSQTWGCSRCSSRLCLRPSARAGGATVNDNATTHVLTIDVTPGLSRPLGRSSSPSWTTFVTCRQGRWGLHCWPC